MSKGITLSPKYGVNPTIPVCFFCGEKKDEIALLGRIGGKQDLEAPRHVVLDYEPCDKCKEQWAKGVALIDPSRTTDLLFKAFIPLADALWSYLKH